ncbi:hypothetical protein V6N13_108127 [Hibiscus sabdariffa]
MDNRFYVQINTVDLFFFVFEANSCGIKLMILWVLDYASVLGSDFFHKFPLLLNSAAMFFWKLHEFRSSSVLVEGSRSLSELESESEVETSEDKG